MTFDEWIDNNMGSLHDSTILGDLRLAFNAGLEAGRPKWHRLQEGSIQILPAVDETVFNEDGDKVVYIGRGKWKSYSEYYEEYVEADPPIAWCEVQQYTEESR